MSLGIQTKSPSRVPVPAFRQTIDSVVLYTPVKPGAAALEQAKELAQGMKLRVRVTGWDHLKSELEKVSQHGTLEVENEIMLRYADSTEIGAQTEQYCRAGIAPPALAHLRREPAE